MRLGAEIQISVDSRWVRERAVDAWDLSASEQISFWRMMYS